MSWFGSEEEDDLSSLGVASGCCLHNDHLTPSPYLTHVGSLTTLSLSLALHVAPSSLQTVLDWVSTTSHLCFTPILANCLPAVGLGGQSINRMCHSPNLAHQLEILGVTAAAESLPIVAISRQISSISQERSGEEGN